MQRGALMMTQYRNYDSQGYSVSEPLELRRQWGRNGRFPYVLACEYMDMGMDRVS